MLPLGFEQQFKCFWVDYTVRLEKQFPLATEFWNIHIKYQESVLVQILLLYLVYGIR